ncbi:MAG TPA: DUF4956 domain-containing protein [Pyrinomonadaceae bacterium]|nr:DUF4956 domain-containing protein [Pyrinomonadaceae bacterium]
MTNGRQRGRGFAAAVVAVALVAGFLVVAALMRGYGSGPHDTNTNAANSSNSAAIAAAAEQGREAGRASVAGGAEQQAQQSPRASEADARPTPTSDARPTPSPAPTRDESSLSKILGEGTTPQSGERRDWLTTAASAAVRLTLAALLAALLAFRPRRYAGSTKRNPYVAQTQILMAVVASALMMIVGDSAARAFGIFGAASLVRFRTNIKDPKEITVLLLSMAIGLSTGVGRWELGLVFTFFVLLLLWGLEYREPEMVTRAMELTVKTRNIGTTQDALLGLFRKYDFPAEMRAIDRPADGDATGCVIYYVDISPQVSTDRLSEELLAADPRSIDGVEWAQQKNTSYFYQ